MPGYGSLAAQVANDCVCIHASLDARLSGLRQAVCLELEARTSGCTPAAQKRQIAGMSKKPKNPEKPPSLLQIAVSSRLGALQRELGRSADWNDQNRVVELGKRTKHAGV
jgi:hypothetical protein